MIWVLPTLAAGVIAYFVTHGAIRSPLLWSWATVPGWWLLTVSLAWRMLDVNQVRERVCGKICLWVGLCHVLAVVVLAIFPLPWTKGNLGRAALALLLSVAYMLFGGLTRQALLRGVDGVELPRRRPWGGWGW